MDNVVIDGIENLKSQISQQGNIIEIINNGNDMLFSDLLIHVILPKRNGGLEKNAIYFDLEHKFNILHFVTMIESLTGAGESDIKAWLKRLNVIRCSCVEQFLVTLVSISGILSGKNKSISQVIFINTITEYYWNNRATGGESGYLREHSIRQVTTILKTYVNDYKSTIVANTMNVINDKKFANQKDFKHFLASCWVDLVDYRYFTT